MSATFTMKNNHLDVNARYVCDLFVDDHEVLHEVSYLEAYNYVLQHGQDEDTYFEQDSGPMKEPMSVKQMRDIENAHIGGTDEGGAS